VAGWERALRRYGTRSLGQLLRPGIRAAKRGFVVDDTFVSQTEDNVEWFDDIPSTAHLYLDPDGTPRDPGARLRNPDLARTYRGIAARGADWFYDGPPARAIVDAAQRPPTAPTADHVWRPGLLSAADIASYRAPEREPTRIGFHGLDVWSMGPPSSGGSTVGEILNILEGYPDLTADRTRALHLFLEASRLSYADRNAFLADPDHIGVPLETLLSDGYAAERRALIDERQAATSPVAPGDPNSSTTHLVVADRHGTVVSYTFTIESIGGNGIVVPGYGFLLNNELTDFNYDTTDHPNSAGPRKRPRSSMAPTIVTRHGRPLLAVGSPGGASIITTVAQVLLERLGLGATLPEAIAQPRASQRNRAATEVEPAFLQTPEAAALIGLGHSFEEAEAGDIGAVTGVELGRSGRMLAAAEPTRRGGGSAAVVTPRP
jgi:gamma-glutamyltranspeptidase/glutathione hydrolase